MNVLFTKRRSILAPTARGNYPIHSNKIIFSAALIGYLCFASILVC